MRVNREFGWEEVGPSQEGERFTFSDEAVRHMVDINERFKALQAEHPVVQRFLEHDSEKDQVLDEIYKSLASEVIYFSSQSGLMISFDWMGWEEVNYWLFSERSNKGESGARPPDSRHGGFDQEADFRIAGQRFSNTAGARYLHQECRRTML